jgi:polysaccharide biosynthesis PFTS motif protein
MMRGYRWLRSRSQIESIAALHSALTATPVELPANAFSPQLFGAAIDRAELVLRQSLLARVGGPGLTKAWLTTLGRPGSRVVHPLPAEWRQALRDHGVVVDDFRCGLLWACYVLMFFAHGVFESGGLMLACLRASFSKSQTPYRRSAHFDGLSAGNLPRPCSDGRSHDIVSWYTRWSERASHLDVLTHTVKSVGPTVIDEIPLVPVSSPLAPLAKLGASMRLVLFTAGAIARSAWDLIRGRWWHALLFREVVRAAMVRLQDPRRLAVDYLFHNSGWIYRPLWTYEAERAGSRVLFYFYSTNCEAFKDARGYPDISYGYRAMSWSHYLAWDHWQADFIRRAVGADVKVSITGPIWFHSSAVEMPHPGPRAVAVFDVQPFRVSLYRRLGMPIEYYVPDVACRFLLDISEAVNELGGEMVLKRKREIGRLLHSRYRKVVEGLARSSAITTIDPEISALRVIEGCAAVISMPFTSTALLGRELNKPSIYYDPFGVIQKDDRAAHGIDVVCGPRELRAWLSTAVAQSQ